MYNLRLRSYQPISTTQTAHTSHYHAHVTIWSFRWMVLNLPGNKSYRFCGWPSSDMPKHIALYGCALARYVKSEGWRDSMRQTGRLACPHHSMRARSGTLVMFKWRVLMAGWIDLWPIGHLIKPWHCEHRHNRTATFRDIHMRGRQRQGLELILRLVWPAQPLLK